MRYPIPSWFDKNPPAPWAVSNHYASRYEISTGNFDYHTGIDVGLPGTQDVGQPVCTPADGTVVHAGFVRNVAGVVNESWQQIVVIKHPQFPLSIWTRLAHITPTVKVGDVVKIGQTVGTIATHPKYSPHLHWDAARIDLGVYPGDWPADDLARLKRDYINPLEITGMPFAREPYDKYYELVDAAWAKAHPDLFMRLCYKALIEDGHSITTSADDAYMPVTTRDGRDGARTIRFWGVDISDPAIKKSYDAFEQAYYPANKPATEIDGDENALPSIPADVVAKLGASTTPPANATVTFSASNNSVVEGTKVTLSWESANISALYFDQGTGVYVGVTGKETRIVVPTATTTYYLKVIHTNGFVQIIAQKVTVTPRPTTPTPPPTGALHAGIARAKAVGNRMQQLCGMNVLNFTEDANLGFAQGCRTFTFMNQMAGANELYDKGSITFVRAWGFNSKWSARQIVDALGLDKTRHHFALLLNEQDLGYGYGSVEALRERFAVEKAACEIIWNEFPNIVPVIGGFSVGTPQLDNPDFAKVFRETYGAFLNANAHRVCINMHLYLWKRPLAELPPADEMVYLDQSWWAGRAATWLWRADGGGLSKAVYLVCDEWTGETGHGGWAQAAYTWANAIAASKVWMSFYWALENMLAATEFIACRSTSWGGYDVRYLWPSVYQYAWAFNTWPTSFPREFVANIPREYMSRVEGADDLIGRQYFAVRNGLPVPTE